MDEYHRQLQLLINIEDQRWYNYYHENHLQIIFTEIIDTLLKVKSLNFGMEVSFVLTNDENIQVLNQQYRAKNKPTNVLSFPMHDFIDINKISDKECIMLGDIVLSFDTISNEAVQKSICFIDHVYHLVVHGLLHLLGYDHIDDDQALIMENLEITILKQLGVADPYAAVNN